jgi:ankyrin repeat protein
LHAEEQIRQSAEDTETRISMERCSGNGFFLLWDGTCLCLLGFDGDACERDPDGGSLAARVLAGELDPASAAEERHRALIYAAAYGRCALAEALLDAGADPNVSCPELQTPLIHAAFAGDACTLQLLLRRGARPDLADDGLTPLTMAALGGHATAADILLNANPDVARWPRYDDGQPHPLSALTAAVMNGSPSTLSLLLERLRGSPDWTTHAGMALSAAAALNDVDGAKAIFQADHTSALITGYGVTALTMAASENRYEAAVYILSLGVDATVSAGDMGPMTAAAIEADERFVQLLLDHGGDVNERAIGCHTPLMIAAENDNLAVARLLLAQGADPGAVGSEGLTARGIAEAHGHDEMARLLSEREGGPPPARAAPACEHPEGTAPARRTGPHGVITRRLDPL